MTRLGVLEHSHRRGYGENLYAGFHDPSAAVDVWYDEIRYHDFSSRRYGIGLLQRTGTILSYVQAIIILSMRSSFLIKYKIKIFIYGYAQGILPNWCGMIRENWESELRIVRSRDCGTLCVTIIRKEIFLHQISPIMYARESEVKLDLLDSLWSRIFLKPIITCTYSKIITFIYLHVEYIIN